MPREDAASPVAPLEFLPCLTPMQDAVAAPLEMPRCARHKLVYGSSIVPIFVHAPQRAIRLAVFHPPTANPYLRIASCP